MNETSGAAAPKMTTARKTALSGICMALYIVIMYFTQGFAFGQYQIRIATSLYALSALYPFLILPLGLSNLLSNLLMGGFGIFDIAGGLAVGLLTSALAYLIKRFGWNDWLIALPIVLIPGLGVPIWLSFLIGVPYPVLAASLVIGQVLPGIVGVILVKYIRKLKIS